MSKNWKKGKKIIETHHKCKNIEKPSKMLKNR